MVMEILFWSSIGLILYSYIAYPVILVLVTKYFIKRNDGADQSDSFEDNMPTVAIIIAAYNEEKEIINRLKNIENLNYPKNKLMIYIGSDASSDKTNTLIENYNLDSLTFYPFSERRGKTSVLNDLCSYTKEDVLIFTDANTMFAESAVIELVSKLNKSNVGGVCGELNLQSSSGSENQDSIYWIYEKFIKQKEGELNGLLGANGAIYAIRRELFKKIPTDTIVDDFMIAINVVLLGYDLVYAPKAKALEYVPDDLEQEFNRRVRIGVGNYQAFFRLFELLNPFNKFRYFFTYFSHKVLRWFTPHLMLLCLMANVFILGEASIYSISLFVQLIIYSAAIACMYKACINYFPKTLKVLIYFVLMNIAFLYGFLKYLNNNINPAWERTARE
jgi:cellulose synthase/poly-beta-1,6-N-acetylglucosamine synthase-like glycosyltransferase